MFWPMQERVAKSEDKAPPVCASRPPIRRSLPSLVAAQREARFPEWPGSAKELDSVRQRVREVLVFLRRGPRPKNRSVFEARRTQFRHKLVQKVGELRASGSRRSPPSPKLAASMSRSPGVRPIPASMFPVNGLRSSSVSRLTVAATGKELRPGPVAGHWGSVDLQYAEFAVVQPQGAMFIQSQAIAPGEIGFGRTRWERAPMSYQTLEPRGWPSTRMLPSTSEKVCQSACFSRSPLSWAWWYSRPLPDKDRGVQRLFIREGVGWLAFRWEDNAIDRPDLPAVKEAKGERGRAEQPLRGAAWEQWRPSSYQRGTSPGCGGVPIANPSFVRGLQIAGPASLVLAVEEHFDLEPVVDLVNVLDVREQTDPASSRVG